MTAATIISSSLSIAGSVLIIITFLVWKDVRRSTARLILVWLAVADLFGAAGYLTAGIGTITFPSNSSNSSEYSLFCTIQSFTTTYFPVVSFFWTAYLAVYFVVNLVLRKHNWGCGLQLVFHLSAWSIPLIVLSFTTYFGLMGPGHHSGTAGWCWVTDSIINYTSQLDHKRTVTEYFMLELVTGKLWEILSYFVVALCYMLIFFFNRCKFQKVSSLIRRYSVVLDYPVLLKKIVL